jgi:hypothetical protein
MTLYDQPTEVRWVPLHVSVAQTVGQEMNGDDRLGTVAQGIGQYAVFPLPSTAWRSVFIHRTSG